MRRYIALARFTLLLGVLGAFASIGVPPAAAHWPSWKCTPLIDGEHAEDDEVPGAYWGCDGEIPAWVIVEWTPEDEVDWAHTYINSSLNICVANFSSIQTNTIFSPYYHRSQVVAKTSGCHVGKTQPVGDLRTQALIQRWNGSSWASCYGTGYTYNSVSGFSTYSGFSQGWSPDCGVGTYRTQAYGHVWEGMAWRGGWVFSPSLYFDGF